MKPPFVISGEGTINIVYNNEQHVIGKDHPNYEHILSAIKSRHYERIEKWLDIAKQISQIGNVTIENGHVLFKGTVLGGIITQRILQFMREGLPYEPLMRFIENLMANPSARSVNELYGFLEHQGLAITEDGCFIAYKGINDDWTDIYSGKIDNSIGSTPHFLRNLVDDNCNNTCSFGLHVGTYEYARHYAGSRRVVLVKVNPADAVAVPADENASKLRVMRYEVIAVAPDKPLQNVGYQITPALNFVEDDFCEACGEDCDHCDHCENN